MNRAKQKCWSFFVLVFLSILSLPLVGLAQFTPNGGTVAIPSTAEAWAGEPRAAVTDSGVTGVVWEEGSEAQDVFLRLFDGSGAALTPAIQVNTTAALDQREPDIASQQSSGLFAVVWESMNQAGADSGLDIVMRLYDASGAAQSSEIVVSTETAGQQKNPRVAIDQSTGTIFVVWQMEGEGYRVLGRFFSIQGNPVGPDLELARSNFDGAHPEVAAGPEGKFVVAWEQGGRNARAVYYQCFSNVGTALDTVPQSTGLTCLPYGHDVAMTSASELVFAVAAVDGSVQSRILSAAGQDVWQGVVPGAPGNNPKLTAIGPGFLLTWTTAENIAAIVYSNGGFSDVHAVSSISKRGLNAVAASALTGHTSVVWESDSESVQGQFFMIENGELPTPTPTPIPPTPTPTTTPTPEPPTPTPTPIPVEWKMMEIVPKTGELAYYGNLVEKGITQAYSALGLSGKGIHRTVNDNQSTIEKSVELTQTAINDPSYLAILGASASRNSVAIAQANGQAADPLVQYTFSSSQQLDTMPYVVKVAPLDNYQVDAMASVLAYNGLSKIFLLYENSPYGSGFKRLETIPGIEIVDEMAFQTGMIETSQVISKLAAAVAAGAQVGVMVGYDADAKAVLQALAAQVDAGLRNFNWIFSDAITTDAVLAGLPFDRTLFYHPVIMGLTPSIADQLQTSIQFKAAYQAAYNQIPEWQAYYAYDTAAAFQAMLSRIPDYSRANLWASVSNLQFEGVTGQKWLDNKGSLQSAIYDVNYVILGKFKIIGEERVKQPSGNGGMGAKVAAFAQPRTEDGTLVYDNFVVRMNGADPLIGHAAGGPQGDAWVAQSRDLDLGWVLVAYYEDAQRTLTDDGQAYGYKDGNQYTLQFELNRQNLTTQQTLGTIMEIEVSSHYQFTNAQGHEQFLSEVLVDRLVSFAEWPAVGPLTIPVPVTYKSLAPLGTVAGEHNQLNWEIRLLNSARQKLTFSSVTIVAGEAAVGDFMLY